MVVCERRRTLDLALLIVHAIDVFLDHRELRAQSGSIGVLFLGALLDARRFEHSLRSLSPRFTHAREAPISRAASSAASSGFNGFGFTGSAASTSSFSVLISDLTSPPPSVQNKAENCHQITKKSWLIGPGMKASSSSIITLLVFAFLIYHHPCRRRSPDRLAQTTAR